MTVSLFLGKFKNDPFWPKLTQIWPKFGHLAQKRRFFAFFSKSVHCNLLIFCFKPSLWSWKKMTFSLFLWNFKNGPFWSKLTQIWPKFGHIWLYETWSMGVQKKLASKILKIFYFFFIFFLFKIEKKTTSDEKNPHFALINTIMTPLSPHLEKFWNS